MIREYIDEDIDLEKKSRKSWQELRKSEPLSSFFADPLQAWHIQGHHHEVCRSYMQVSQTSKTKHRGVERLAFLPRRDTRPKWKQGRAAYKDG